MNITLVTVDRSTWFQPQFFDLSHGFMNNNPDLKWTEWPDVWGIKATDAVREGIHKGNTISGPMPCFPTVYMLCKDVDIEITAFSIDNEASHKTMVEQTASSGGFLGFRCTGTHQGSSDQTSASVKIAKDGLIVRIPGSQILGYIQQVMPRDETVPYSSEMALQTTVYLPNDSLPITTHDSHGAPRGFEPETREEVIRKRLRSFNPVRSGPEAKLAENEESKKSKPIASNAMQAQAYGPSMPKAPAIEVSPISDKISATPSSLETKLVDRIEQKILDDPEFMS